jgi:pyruvate-formate lyase-activating enzyme
LKPLPVVEAPSAPRALPFLTSAAPVRFGAGFYDDEHAEGLPFRWMSLTGRLEFEAQLVERHLELWVRGSFHDLSQHLEVRIAGAAGASHELVHGWNPLSVAVPAGAAWVELHCNKLFPREYYPGDTRELAVQVRSTTIHGDAARHGHVARQHANHVANVRELLDGKVVLDSTPPKLGIDMTGVCNVKPPCVYCAWDFNKDLEGGNVDVPFGLDTLDHYGAFFDNSLELVNCSIGEPFMMRNIDELLDAFGDRNKVLEVTTNGQILTDTNIRKLLGRNAHLYISLDAATPETYKKLRSDAFPRLLDNVRRLVKAKGGRGRLPLVYLVFMPMRANVHEVDDFVRLVAELGADRLVLRPLNDSEGVNLVWDRAGYHYDYQSEILPFEQLVHVSGRVAELCRLLDIELSDQMNFGGSLEAQFQAAFDAGRHEAAAVLARGTPPAAREPALAPSAPASAPVLAPAPEPVRIPAPAANAPKPSLGGERLPACTEPWSSLYILRRGTMPCCYGGRPIAPMGEFQQAWNGPLIQGIRRELLHGRFHDYCFASPDCPIVKKAEQSRGLSPLQAAQLWGRRLHDRWARARYGWPGTVYRSVKRQWLTVLGRAPKA